MSKQGRQPQRQSGRAARAEANRRAARRRQLRPIFFGGALAIIGAVIAVAAVTSSGHSSGLPSGTQVFAENDHQHVTGTVRYDHNPPTGGAHNAVWLNCGVYTARVPNENAVHDLEHGSVWITYRPSLSASGVAELQQFVESNYDGTQRYLLLSPFPGLPAPVVASAWGAQIRLNGPADPRLARFVAHFIGGNQGGEHGAPCTGGTGSPVG